MVETFDVKRAFPTPPGFGRRIKLYPQADLDRAAQEARAVALQEAAKVARSKVHSGTPEAIATHIEALLDTPAAEALERVRAEEREACAKVAEQWTKAGEILLRAGEMATPELNTAKAVARGILTAIRARGET